MQYFVCGGKRLYPKQETTITVTRKNTEEPDIRSDWVVITEKDTSLNDNVAVVQTDMVQSWKDEIEQMRSYSS